MQFVIIIHATYVGLPPRLASGLNVPGGHRSQTPASLKNVPGWHVQVKPLDSTIVLTPADITKAIQDEPSNLHTGISTQPQSTADALGARSHSASQALTITLPLEHHKPTQAFK